jgi:GH24 family phage-related lysozyme (muramidase)
MKEDDLMNQWRWCVTDSDNKVIKGWYQDTDGFWYYLNNEGVMQTGWIQDTNGDWYYLYPEKTTNYGVEYPIGAMAIDWVKLGDKSKWYYLLKEQTEYNGDIHFKGACVCNVSLNINGQNYAFDSNGVLQSGSTDNSNILISQEQVGFTGGFEGMDYNAVEDPYYPNDQRYWTIGHGTCFCAIPEAFPNGLDSVCTEEQADKWLAQEMSVVANKIKEALGDTYNSISQQIFDVMCDIGYNAGTADLIGGNTWNALISGDSNSIKTWLMKWCNANDQNSNGLYKRCVGRVNVALYGDYSARP